MIASLIRTISFSNFFKALTKDVSKLAIAASEFKPGRKFKSMVKIETAVNGFNDYHAEYIDGEVIGIDGESVNIKASKIIVTYSATSMRALNSYIAWFLSQIDQKVVNADSLKLLEKSCAFKYNLNNYSGWSRIVTLSNVVWND